MKLDAKCVILYPKVDHEIDGWIWSLEYYCGVLPDTGYMDHAIKQ